MTHRTESTYISRSSFISQSLRIQIQRGDYAPGAQLPSEHELSRAYGVQRDTVRRALKRLVDEGLIFKRPGKGSFVSDGQERITLTVDRAHLNDPVVAYLLASGSSLSAIED